MSFVLRSVQGWVMAMIFGSVCSGIESASVAWEPLGWRAAFVSEIEPFPYFCPRCDRAYDLETGEQIQNWAWIKSDKGFMPNKRYEGTRP